MSEAKPPRPTTEQLARYAEQFNGSKTMQHFGVRIRFPDLEHVEVLLDPIRPEQRGGLGTAAVNGGVLAAVFDLAIGCTPALVDPTRRTATMQLSMSFMKPVTGNKLRADGRVDSAGKNMLYASSQIFDEQG